MYQQALMSASVCWLASTTCTCPTTHVPIRSRRLFDESQAASGFGQNRTYFHLSKKKNTPFEPKTSCSWSCFEVADLSCEFCLRAFRRMKIYHNADHKPGRYEIKLELNMTERLQFHASVPVTFNVLGKIEKRTVDRRNNELDYLGWNRYSQ